MLRKQSEKRTRLTQRKSKFSFFNTFEIRYCLNLLKSLFYLILQLLFVIIFTNIEMLESIEGVETL